jgi:integrase
MTIPKRMATKLHLLTVREVQAAGDGDHSDGGGLLLRVRGASSSWVLRFTSPAGRRREMGLGHAHRASAAQAGAALTTARELAAKARETLRQGQDPIDQRDQAKEAAQGAEHARKATAARVRWTLARAARDYHERAVEPIRTAKHAAQWIASLENHLPAALWNKPIADIEPHELLAALGGVRALDDKDARVPETLRRLRQRLDSVFEDAVFYKRCAGNAAAAVRRKLRETTPRKQAGQFAALPYREAPAFMARLRSAPGTAARCLELAVLTAARTSEALLAEWREFDLDAAVWVVPAERMKGGEPHTVQLSDRALAVLRQQFGLDPRYVFPTPMPSNEPRPMSNMAMLAVLDRLGVRDCTTVHGLCRSTFSTWANETGAARPDVIEACLAHSEADKVRKAYNRAQFNVERKALLAAWAQYLSAPAANVVPLRAA